MSFSSKVKDELSAIQTKRQCCRRALAAGIFFDAETDGEERLLASFSTKSAALTAARAASLAYGSSAVPSEPKASGSVYDVAVLSENAVKDLGSTDVFSCAECASSFLRGLIISLASITSPTSQYHFELLLTHTERAEALIEFFSDNFSKPIETKRRRGIGLVYKNSSAIEDILSTSGAMQAYFDLVNGKIERDLRNNINRAINCETRNIARAVKAAKQQVEAIELLTSANELDKLPQELRETATLRMLYPDIPLSELAARHCPPISKSGINHRISKLIDAARKLK